MSKARLVITAVVVEGRTQSEVADAYGVSQGWISRLVARYRAEGEAAFEPRSRRPKSSPNTISGHTRDLIVDLRHTLTGQGHDAGADTIVWHLIQHHGITVSRATVWRTLKRAGLVEAEPKKKPKSSYTRFQAEMPYETWQSDFTHWPLADCSDTEIVTFLDDHSRYALNITAFRRVTVGDVDATFLTSIEKYGPPAATLSDNGKLYKIGIGRASPPPLRGRPLTPEPPSSCSSRTDTFASQTHTPAKSSGP